MYVRARQGVYIVTYTPHCDQEATKAPNFVDDKTKTTGNSSKLIDDQDGLHEEYYGPIARSSDRSGSFVQPPRRKHSIDSKFIYHYNGKRV